jgi:hypothetical protein
MELGDIAAIQIPEFDAEAHVIEQEAVVCGPGYQFEFRETRRPTGTASGSRRFRCYSAPPKF